MTRDYHDDLVSVIIPCHNRSSLLRECLESVAGQSYRPIEVIVVDDASTEDIEAVVNEVAWPEGICPIYLRSEENVGPGAARELGRQRASGAFISYLDSDDLWDARKVALQVEALRAEPDAGMCYCTAVNCEEETGQKSVRKCSDQSFASFLPQLLRFRPWGTGACMWTRVATDQIGRWFPGWTFEDYEYDCRAGCLDIQIVHIPKALCYYRKHQNGRQLSRMQAQQRWKQQALALFEMAKNLEYFGKLDDRETKQNFLRMLYRAAMKLLSYQENQRARQCLALISQIDSRTSRSVWAANALIWLEYFIPATLVARLGRRMRSRLFV